MSYRAPLGGTGICTSLFYQLSNKRTWTRAAINHLLLMTAKRQEGTPSSDVLHVCRHFFFPSGNVARQAEPPSGLCVGVHLRRADTVCFVNWLIDSWSIILAIIFQHVIRVERFNQKLSLVPQLCELMWIKVTKFVPVSLLSPVMICTAFGSRFCYI